MLLAIIVLFTSVDVSVFASDGEESDKIVQEIVSEEVEENEDVCFVEMISSENEDMKEEMYSEDDLVESFGTGNTLVDAIIKFAKNNIHSNAWSGYCQAFVKECYEAA